MQIIPAEIISRKRDGRELSPQEIEAFLGGFTRHEVAPEQMAAWAMAIYFRGMTFGETAALTRAMRDSGRVLCWPPGPPVADKHSTGGLGDKVSLLLAPMMACCGLRVPMISGRGLGPTGGTLDKLESIAGYRTDLTLDEIQALVADVGCVITGATRNLAPADQRLYALRDVTGTVPSIPLITASILSKKLAEGLDALVLDVKCGCGAFMKDLQQARELAQSLVRTGAELGLKTKAVITDMNQPLGRMVGNALEVDEAAEALQGACPDDLLQVTCTLGAELLLLTDKAKSRAEALLMCRQTLESGAAWQRFRAMVAAQGGDLDAPRRRAPATRIPCSRRGYVAEIDTAGLGMAIISLGGGRQRQDDAINHAVGFRMLARIGDWLDPEDPLVEAFVPPEQLPRIVPLVQRCIRVLDEPVLPPRLILEWLH